MNEPVKPQDNCLTMTTKHEGDLYVVYMENFPLGHFNTAEEAERYTVTICEIVTGSPFIYHEDKR